MSSGNGKTPQGPPPSPPPKPYCWREEFGVLYFHHPLLDRHFRLSLVPGEGTIPPVFDADTFLWPQHQISLEVMEALVETLTLALGEAKKTIPREDD